MRKLTSLFNKMVRIVFSDRMNEHNDNSKYLSIYSQGAVKPMRSSVKLELILELSAHTNR